MDKKLWNITKNYTSRMNTTKWREVVKVLTSIPEYEVYVAIKYIFDKTGSSFSPVWWNEIERDGFECIEWLKIDPIKKTYIGQLVKDETEDFSHIIKDGFDKYSIPYEVKDNIFLIYGYAKMQDVEK